ncbi:hypothetical protein HXX76_013932 [Chlamydomonas incerta]|uniref:Uncharacterized protein n=1 Tax=Chlamydomonas incerta TaxID=51695 RepID=A0A835SKI2_CHLIN|nr:hypothetical protein HXX76_013932 [Chlamydomonas incerta]|eukprot:KAG2425178.1 hypothetical protein HXX76_013932 [Chlamydomonas incerta]
MSFTLTYWSEPNDGSAAVPTALAPSITWLNETTAVIAQNLTVEQFNSSYLFGVCVSSASRAIKADELAFVVAPHLKEVYNVSSGAPEVVGSIFYPMSISIKLADAAVAVRASACDMGAPQSLLDEFSMNVKEDANLLMMYSWTVTWMPVTYPSPPPSSPPSQQAEPGPLDFLLTYVLYDSPSWNAIANFSALAPSITWRDEYTAVLAYKMTVQQYSAPYLLILCVSAAPTIDAEALGFTIDRNHRTLRNAFSASPSITRLDNSSDSSTIRMGDAQLPITTAEECLDNNRGHSLPVGIISSLPNANMIIMYQWTVTWRPINHAAALSSEPSAAAAHRQQAPSPPPRPAAAPRRRAPPPRFRANRGMLRNRRNA